MNHRHIASLFALYGDFVSCEPYGSGHINDTFKLVMLQSGRAVDYILQRVNTRVFQRPVELMENIERVTRHQRLKLAGDPDASRKALTLVPTTGGKPFALDGSDFWRCYLFIENAQTYDVLKNTSLAYSAAFAFGGFQSSLADLPAPRLHEVIPGFHDTPRRVARLEEVAKLDPMGRLASARAEFDAIMARKDEYGKLINLGREGAIPERITHNDTKVNNLLIDDFSGEGICVLDLDTVMPGLCLYDFGDMVRTGTNTAEEDEVNLDKVQMSFPMFEAILRGYLSSAGGFLTPAERENLPFSGKLITLEVGIRFLTDYLSGDKYFKTRRPTHNLERARNQFKLVECIEQQMDKMNFLVKSV